MPTDPMTNKVTRQRMPTERHGITRKCDIQAAGGVQEGYITVNKRDGQVAEVLLHGWGKEGSTMEGWIQVAAVLISLGLQAGVPLETICEKLGGMKFEPSGATENPAIPTCTSIPDYLSQHLKGFLA
jgi:hypothetical protein